MPKTSDLPIDNTPIENSIRPIALGKENWLLVQIAPTNEQPLVNPCSTLPSLAKSMQRLASWKSSPLVPKATAVCMASIKFLVALDTYLLHTLPGDGATLIEQLCFDKKQSLLIFRR